MQSEELCEYVDLFYKVDKIPPGSSAKNYFKVHSFMQLQRIKFHFHVFCFSEKETKMVRVIDGFNAGELSLGALRQGIVVVEKQTPWARGKPVRII